MDKGMILLLSVCSSHKNKLFSLCTCGVRPGWGLRWFCSTEAPFFYTEFISWIHNPNLSVVNVDAFT